eukprot:scaffold41531_cov387-Skeletonema_marinoi.AAC.1
MTCEHEDNPYVRRAFVMLTLRLCRDERIDVSEAVRRVAEMDNPSLFKEIEVIDQNLHRRIKDRIDKRNSPEYITLNNCFATWRQLKTNYGNYMEFLEEHEEIRQIANSLIDDMGDDIGTIASTHHRFKTAIAEIGFNIKAPHFQRVMMFMSMTEIEPEVAIARVNTVFGNAAPPDKHEMLGVDGNLLPDDNGVAQPHDGGVEAEFADLQHVPAAEKAKEETVSDDEDSKHNDEQQQHSDAVVIQHAGATETLLSDENRSQHHAGAKRNIMCFYAMCFYVLFVTISFAMTIHMKYFRSPAHEGITAPSDGSTQEGSDIWEAVGSGASTAVGKGSFDFDATNATSDTDKAG